MTASAWQSPHKDSKSRLKHLFETKALSDCSFMVGKTNAQLVLGHSVIISAASPVLEDKLKAPGTDPKVTLTDVEPEIFQLMLKYIYTDSVDVNSETACDLAAAAMAYQMPHLMNACLEYITANLTTKNVLQAYGLVLHSDDSELKKKCEELIKTKTKVVLADSSFEEACLDVVVAVFSLESLDVESELDLLNAADRYAKHITKCNNVNSETLDIRKVLQKIRFLSLTPTEFAKGRATTTVLSDSDACAILANVAYDKATTPMPEGFTLIKDPRKMKQNQKSKIKHEWHSEMKFKFRVLDINNVISKKEEKWSDILTFQNTKWKIHFLIDKQFIGLYAWVNWDEPKTWSCKTEIEFKLLRADKGEPVSELLKFEFSKESTNRGYAEFIEISKLQDPNNHYIEDGAVTFQFHIKADEPQGL